MNTFVVLSLVAAAFVAYVSSQEPVHQHCTSDADCVSVPCMNSTEASYCHEKECHCHSDPECTAHSDCKPECGDTATCDENGHCHGPNCIHV